MHSRFDRFLPKWRQPYQHGFLNSEKVALTLSSMKWMAIDQGFRLIISFILSVGLARWLGPEQFGYYNYLLAFVALFAPISKINVESFVIKELIQEIHDKYQVIGTLFFTRLFFSAVALAGSLLVMRVLRPTDNLSFVLVLLLSLLPLLQSAEVIEHWFQSRFHMRGVLSLKLFFIVSMTVIKMLVLFHLRSLPIFIALYVLEQLLIAFAQMLYFYKKENRFLFNIDFSYAVKILRTIGPLVISGLFVMVYAKSDQLFLQFFLGGNAVAQYSVALIVTEVFATVAVVICRAVTPALLGTANQSNEVLQARMQFLYRFMTLLSLVMILGIWLIVIPLIPIIYGEAYITAQLLLGLLSFRLLFSNIGIARWIVVTREHLFGFDVFTKFAGAFLSVLFNIILIPKFGVIGATIGSFIALCFSTFIFDYFHPLLRENLKNELSSIISLHKIRLSQVK